LNHIQAATGSKFSLLPADNATGNFVKVVQRIPVRIALLDDKNDKFDLRAGMNVTVAVKVK
jgi:membrane fusion protein (multidrug efflux system)